MKQQLEPSNIRLEYLSDINYSLSSSGYKYIRTFELINDDDCDWHDVVLTLSSEQLHPSVCRLDMVPMGQSVAISDLSISPNIDQLRVLTESINSQFTLQVTIGGAEVFSTAYPIRLMPFDHWLGSLKMPEILASFVTPNAPCLAQVRLDAAAILGRLTGSNALDDYQTQDPNRVRKMMASVYEALHDQGLVYITPSPSFETNGQRIRLCDKVLSEKQGTCADLTLLMASVLEGLGLHPLIILAKGHMYLGCWLEDRYYPQLFCDDVSFISKSIADGVSEMAVVETTMLTAKDATFEKAVKAAEDHIRLTPDDFIMAIDVFRCRQFGIRPLPGKEGEAQELEGADTGSASGTVREVRQFNISSEGGRPVTRQQIWERKLLDFSLRNNLLNMRIGKNVVPFISFDSHLLEDKLQSKTDFRLLGLPVDKNVKADADGIFHSSAYTELLGPFATEGVRKDEIYSYLDDDDLRNALKGLYRSSRTALEENGANTLYLVLGLLKWYETDVSVKPRFAPLILEPVDLIRKGSNYVLRLREDEITFNTTLLEMMRQQYEVNLGAVVPLPTDASGVDVIQVYTAVRKAIKERSRWDVLEETYLGLFSFSKFVMWNDIHNNAELMRQNPIVASLLQNQLVGIEPATGTDIRQIDHAIAPGDYAIPVDVDSSQLEAVVESGEGRSFILYGPPGTGKSQTITNMISNALYHNRRVLFVAEKMAALEVVQKRLAKVGLAPFCLEMHSNKMTKTHLLGQLESALNLTRLKSPEEYEREAAALYEQRQHLIKYVDLLHTKQPTGLSLYDYIARYSSLESDDELAPTDDYLKGLTAERIEQTVASIEQLGAVFRLTGQPGQSVLSGLFIHETADIETRVNAFLRHLLEVLPKAIDTLRALGSACGGPLPETFIGCHQADQLVQLLAATPAFNAAIAHAATTPDQLGFWKKHISTGQELAKVRGALASLYLPDIEKVDLVGLKRSWAEAKDKFFLTRPFAKKSVLKMLRGYRGDITYDDIDPLISQLESYHRLADAVAQNRSEAHRIFGDLAAPGREQWTKMADSLAKAPDIIRLMTAMGVASGIGTLDQQAVSRVDMKAIRELNSLTSASASFCTIDPRLTLGDIMQKGNRWVQSLAMLRNWAQWCLRRKELTAGHLKPVVDYIESGHDEQQASLAMQRGLYHRLALNVIDGNADLRIFNGIIFEDAIEKYRKIAKDFQTLTKKALYCKLAARVPSQTLAAASSSEIGKLKRYIQSGGRGTSIRKIIDEIPTLLPKLCPCMLMSPISVAQYIDLTQDKFDIVVFDEASQMPTSEAVGAIARGKGLIVVGDPRQMPPTSFFTTTSVDESEADIDDMESILDDCITLSFPEHYLTWHYRSKHESLIAFSNSQYYDGKLFTFPSVDDRASKVSFVPIEGTYDMGKSRRNQAEAEAIVKEVIRRLRDPELSKQSIGIVSFSKAQQDLIEDILVEELSKDSKLEAKAYDCEEPIFVKNLENVQGDERDVILFSVGYGPDKSGKLSMNFGPLNNNGGERRLNVAVSRARCEMMVFSTMQPEQIDLNRSRARGVEGLKRFLEFAKSGRMPIMSGQIGEETDTSVIDAIAAEIRAAGYEVDTLVGRSQFKIDLGVIDPTDPARYLLGIICDGRNYYRTPTQRDREICQPGVLKGLGWNLMRVWCIDWFLNRAAITDRITDTIEQLIEERKNPKSTKAPEEEKAPTVTTKAAGSGQTQAQRSGVADIPFKVDESDIIAEVSNDNEVPYTEAQIAPRYTNAQPNVLLLMRRNVMSDISTIIETEQPITLGTLRRRVMAIYGQARTSDRLQEALNKGMQQAFIDPLSSPDNPTLWTNAQAAKSYDKYRKASGRAVEDMPVAEIRNAALLTVTQQLSLPVDDLARFVVKVLGFTRRTPKFDELFNTAIDSLVRDRLIQKEGEMVKTLD